MAFSIEQYLSMRSDLPDRARAIIRAAWAAPSARAKSGGRSVDGFHPSLKNGYTVLYKGHKLELPAIILAEHDPHVLGYADHPDGLTLSYTLADGTRHAAEHNPTFLVARRDGVGWEEWRREEDLVRLSASYPGRYIRDEDGGWRCPPGEAYAAELAMIYRVRSNREINWALVDNLTYLSDYIQLGINAPVDEDVARVLVECVREQPGITVTDLRRHTEAEVNGQEAGAVSAAISLLILRQALYVDLTMERLSQPDRAHVYTDAVTARAYAIANREPSAGTIATTPTSGLIAIEPGNSLVWDGRIWQVLNTGGKKTALVTEGEGGQIVEIANDQITKLIASGRITASASERQIVPGLSDEGRALMLAAGQRDREVANKRYETIAGSLQSGRLPEFTADLTPRSTYCRWLALYREAERRHGNGYVGLLPAFARSGRRGPRFGERTLEMIEWHIKNVYETLDRPNLRSTYARLVAKCINEGVRYPSYQAFSRYVKARPIHKQQLARKGKRGAYKDEPWYWELDLSTPRHGGWPFAIAHIDHTWADVELVTADGQAHMRRAWVSLMVDAYTRAVIARYTTFDSPSYRSCMMLLRDCVRRHGRLPQIFVVDGAVEFGSTYFDTMMAFHQITKKTRPWAKPRYGTIVERLYGTADSEFFHTLKGNTQNMRQARTVTKASDPKGRAVWSLWALHVALSGWLDLYNDSYHGTLGMSPNDAMEEGLAQSGLRGARLIRYDTDFVTETLPSTRKGAAKVISPGAAVKINNIYYSCPEMDRPDVLGTTVPVRYDPWDAGVAYAYIDGIWRDCHSEHYALLRGHTEKEMMQASATLREQYQARGLNATITARRLGEFLNSVTAAEALREQRLRDAETRPVIEAILGNTVLPTISDALAGPSEMRQLAAPTNAPDNLQIEAPAQAQGASTGDWSLESYPNAGEPYMDDDADFPTFGEL